MNIELYPLYIHIVNLFFLVKSFDLIFHFYFRLSSANLLFQINERKWFKRIYLISIFDFDFPLFFCFIQKQIIWLFIFEYCTEDLSLLKLSDALIMSVIIEPGRWTISRDSKIKRKGTYIFLYLYSLQIYVQISFRFFSFVKYQMQWEYELHFLSCFFISITAINVLHVPDKPIACLIQPRQEFPLLYRRDGQVRC